MALTNIKRKRLVLADNVCIVGEKVRPRDPRKSIEHFGARTFDEVPHFETASPGGRGAVLRIRIDFAAGLLEDSVQSPGARLKRTYVCARMRIASVQAGRGIDECLSTARPACRRTD